MSIVYLLMMPKSFNLIIRSRTEGVATPSVRERIIKLKDLGIINKYTIDINYTLLGFEIDVFIDIIIKNNLYRIRSRTEGVDKLTSLLILFNEVLLSFFKICIIFTFVKSIVKSP